MINGDANESCNDSEGAKQRTSRVQTAIAQQMRFSAHDPLLSILIISSILSISIFSHHI